MSNVYARGWVPHTCIAMASTVRIFSKNSTTGNFKQIGLVQSFKPTDTRKTERARGVGFGDRVAEIVPGLTDVSITVTRMALYEESILDSFGYTTGFNQGGTNSHVRTLAHQKNPFDINEVIVFHARRDTGKTPGAFATGGSATVPLSDYTSFWYSDCWMNNWARTIEITGNLIYMEDVTIDVTWVSDGLEPGPYQETDVWDTHGIGCNNSSLISPDEVFTQEFGLDSNIQQTISGLGVSNTTTSSPLASNSLTPI